jgi:hypothetical protein
MTEEAVSILKECTKLHEGSLVHCDETIVFSCGQTSDPPAGVRLYGCPTEEDLLADTLSPVWSVFYAGYYCSLGSSKPSTKSSTETVSGSSTDSPSSCSAGETDTL